MPTMKQEQAAINAVGNGGNVTQAMIDAGYSKATANTPQKLTDTKGWKELMDKYLPDDKLLDTHAKLLDSKRDEIRLQATGLGYKVKGKLIENVVNQQINVGTDKGNTITFVNFKTNDPESK